MPTETYEIPSPVIEQNGTFELLDRDFVTTDDADAEHIVVVFNGNVEALVQEAKAGDHGYIRQVKTIEKHGKLHVVYVDGFLQTEKREGKVELYRVA